LRVRSLSEAGPGFFDLTANRDEAKISIATEPQSELKNYQPTIYITDAVDLLAAWQFQRKSSPKHSKNLCKDMAICENLVAAKYKHRK